ncbi:MULTISPECIES: type IV toxin-antitoxin system AbiEi family antitoxin [unclassified Rathayibacter]|uniref:type IV toxin-antitoxin system AbiEi family antitoxin n=1 Tax=unclassified Rathayibacter TaxID=2609250 RepID=UPI0010F26387|nr:MULTISPECIES: type IV toxin-antitoxin system AbiEi family antitoxin [unclassified Rathayibacter]TCL83858.1 transcriptional regulator with AbiEi antitoxin domain of type IV toxin-antitoxin system [Rathayibacter sp. PhB192]TCM29451.1 transcriptional regulator with AbiEi antitoxin domain of type IV toxin-antitoxin system [Rathayibacter sp. PhB179]
MTRLLPSVLLPGQLPLAELCAARLDGEVVALDEGFLLADLPVGPAERGAALRAVVPAKAVADRLSAAWVHGTMPAAPAVHSASIDRRNRLHPPMLARVRFHEVRLTDEDVVLLGGCSVTTPERTLIDLARTRSTCDDDLLRSLAAVTGVSLERVLERLDSGPPVSSRRIALLRLTTALG